VCLSGTFGAVGKSVFKLSKRKSVDNSLDAPQINLLVASIPVLCFDSLSSRFKMFSIYLPAFKKIAHIA
jgi:hypothetical protein